MSANDKGELVVLHFAESMRTRAADAFGCLLEAKTMKDAEHNRGVLFGLQWACDAFSLATGYESGDVLAAKCGVSSGYINDAFTAALARMQGGAK